MLELVSIYLRRERALCIFVAGVASVLTQVVRKRWRERLVSVVQPSDPVASSPASTIVIPM